MRRDAFIENDSGGLSILAADAVDEIIEDERADDLRFVSTYKALLLELYGDDSMPVRIVVGEPLRPDEEGEWLARASWRLDTTNGQLLVMGGFDPDVLADWKEASGGNGDGRGVASFSVEPGSWRVDVYAHVGSMNGRRILHEADEKPGTAFRRTYPGRALPLWLAKMLEFSRESDPGFEEQWQDIPASIAAGTLAIDTDGGDAIGFLVHCTRFSGDIDTPPPNGWFARDGNRRLPARFPLGLASEVPDPELRHFRDRLLGRRAPAPSIPAADAVANIIAVWSGDPLKPVDGGPVPIPLDEAFLLYWMAALTADATPLFELWVEPAGSWTPPASTPEFATLSKAGGSIHAIGPSPASKGWPIWWAARTVAASLTDVPDGSTIYLGMAPRPSNDDSASAVGRAVYSGPVRNGQWDVAEASPRITRDSLEQAIGFTRAAAMDGRIHVRDPRERQAFDAAAAFYSPEEGSLVWDGDVVHLADPDDRTLAILASAVFRARFGDVWPVDVEESS
jgi:hypothetical protein